MNQLIKPHLLQGRKLLGRLYDGARALTPGRNRAFRTAMTAQREAIGILDSWSRKEQSKTPAIRRVLIDGMWDNANYWIRYAVLRRALHLTGAHETGLLGRFSRKRARQAFACQGIDELIDYHAQTESRGSFIKQARSLLADTRTVDDMFKWSLPYGFPGSLVFDGILKRQRRGTVDLTDPLLPGYVAEAISCIEVADRIVTEGGYDLIVLSHALDYTYAALAWSAVRHKVPVIVLYGNYGTARFMRMTKPSDLFGYPGRPSNAELDALPAAASQSLTQHGGLQLGARLKGQAQDVGSVYSYRNRQGRIDRQSLCDKFGWDPVRPLICVYASNWFDYPHASGLRGFQDFQEWMQLTLSVAAQCKDVNWLFKAHPCEDWYPEIRGLRLDDMIEQADSAHLRLVDKSWNGLDLVQCLDGVITCHGTIGLEAASLGKPVLTAYQGWYGHVGFSVTPENRDGYIAALRSQWWTGWDADGAAQRANLMAGWYFCLPDWHGGYIYRDDSDQDANYAGLEEFLTNNTDAIAREIETLRDWYQSGHLYYHVFKVSRTRRFQTTDVSQFATPGVSLARAEHAAT